MMTKGLRMGSYVRICYQEKGPGHVDDKCDYEGTIVDKRIGGQDRESYVELQDCIRIGSYGEIIAKEKKKRFIDAFIVECGVTDKVERPLGGELANTQASSWDATAMMSGFAPMMGMANMANMPMMMSGMGNGMQMMPMQMCPGGMGMAMPMSMMGMSGMPMSMMGSMRGAYGAASQGSGPASSGMQAMGGMPSSMAAFRRSNAPIGSMGTSETSTPRGGSRGSTRDTRERSRSRGR